MVNGVRLFLIEPHKPSRYRPKGLDKKYQYAFMKKKLYIITSLFLVIIMLLLILPFLIFTGETRKNYFKSYQEAINSDEVNRGWIHEFIPPTALEIYEEHDLDTNCQKLRFDIPKQDKINLTEHLQPINLLEIKDSRPAGASDWWTINSSTPVQLFKTTDKLGRLAYLAAIDNPPRIFYWVGYPPPSGEWGQR
jgi:hypothetical protein